ncbi:hypothetical protein PIB30_029118 [Stylosanthes scabra]|uniref:Uncharacterized protein n=1 Tax=Stylosanthes scabra TaxID=79078 RepID=A0ABU6VDD9_9FABA|nr:hypothetical protein [Stylosanthes scabra]
MCVASPLCKRYYDCLHVNRDGFTINKAAGEIEGNHHELFNEAEVATAAEEKKAEIDPSQTWNKWCQIVAKIAIKSRQNLSKTIMALEACKAHK